MIIMGASGHALEILDILLQNKPGGPITFFDNISPEITQPTIKNYPILRTIEELEPFFKKDNSFVLGTGSPSSRRLLMSLCMKAGGVANALIAKTATISHIGVSIGSGINIMHGAILQPHCAIGNGTLINCRAIIHHESVIGDFCEISPGVIVTGNVTVGNDTTIGTGAVILPKIKIGNNAYIAAGAVVTKDVPDNTMVAGVPAIFKKKI